MGQVTAVEIKEAPTGPVSPAAPAAVDPNRPAWLPEKFKSPEDFAKSYTELEKKLGSQAQPAPASQTPAPVTPATPPATPPAQQQTQAPAKPDLSKYEQEFATTGKFSDQSYAELEAAGIPRTMVDQYAAGVKAASEKALSEVYSVVGGEQQFAQVFEWAKSGLSAEEKASFDKAVKASDLPAVKLAVAGMYAKMQQAQARQYGTDPKLLGGARPATSGIQPFANWGQVTKAMSDPRYREDAAYRAEVEQRVGISQL